MTTRSVLVKVIVKIVFVCTYGTSGCCSVLAGAIPRRFYTIDPVDAPIGIAFGPANTLQEVSLLRVSQEILRLPSPPDSASIEQLALFKSFNGVDSQLVRYRTAFICVIRYSCRVLVRLVNSFWRFRSTPSSSFKGVTLQIRHGRKT